MKRLADLIRNDGITLPWWAWDYLSEQQRSALALQTKLLQQAMVQDMTVLEITNVSSMLWEIDKPFNVYEFPNLAPPWECFWIEHARPRSDPQGVSKEWNGTKEWNEALATQREEDIAAVKVDRIGVLVESLPRDLWPESKNGAIERTRWVLRLTMYLGAERSVHGPNATWHILLDDNGKTLEFQYVIPNFGVDPEAVKNGMDGYSAMLIPTMYAISLLHCKNVEVIKLEGPAKLQKARRKRGQLPLATYRVIQVDGKKEERRQHRSNATGTGSGSDERRFHIVPGHFAHFGDCCPAIHEPKGLAFGRLTGVFWMPMHARGNPERGKIHTDYEIELESA